MPWLLIRTVEGALLGGLSDQLGLPRQGYVLLFVIGKITSFTDC